MPTGEHLAMFRRIIVRDAARRAVVHDLGRQPYKPTLRRVALTSCGWVPPTNHPRAVLVHVIAEAVLGWLYATGQMHDWPTEATQ